MANPKNKKELLNSGNLPEKETPKKEKRKGGVSFCVMAERNPFYFPWAIGLKKPSSSLETSKISTKKIKTLAHARDSFESIKSKIENCCFYTGETSIKKLWIEDSKGNKFDEWENTKWVPLQIELFLPFANYIDEALDGEVVKPEEKK